MGQMPEEAKKEIKDAVAGATDLSKIVRKKKAERSVPPEESISTASNGTKRKASGGLDGDMEIRSPKLGNNLKKAKVEEVEDDVS